MGSQEACISFLCLISYLFTFVYILQHVLLFIYTLYYLPLLKMLQKVPEQQSRLQDYCTATVFMKVLLLNGYGFDQNSFPHISFQKKVSSEHTCVKLSEASWNYTSVVDWIIISHCVSCF